LTGDKLVETTETGVHQVLQSVTCTSGVTYTYSCYVKAAERTFATITLASTAFSTTQILVNISAKSISTNSGTPVASSISDVGGGWLRVTVTQTATATGNGNGQTGVYKGTTSYTGDGYSGIYIWGAQLEEGAFPTSYIPTVASQVTRAADAPSMTGTNFSSWYNQNEGSLYVEATPVQTGTQYVAIIGDGVTSTLGIGFFTDVNQLAARVRGSGGSSTIGGTLSITANTAFKAMLSYAAYNNAWAYNGANRATGNTNIKPENNATLQIGSSPTGGTNLTGTIKKLSLIV
jgi:hypothetical protein